MILTEEKHLRLCELLENIPESNWKAIESAIKEQQPKELEIYTYLQKLYEDDKFRLIATFEDGTDKKLDFIEFTDKREKPFKEEVWDNDAWMKGVLSDVAESQSELDNELLPIAKQFIKQVIPINYSDGGLK